MKIVLLLVTHLVAGLIGFAAGIYALPILTAPPPPADAEVAAAVAAASFTGEFRRNLPGSDALHWGEGMVAVGPDAVTLRGRLAPGPDYKLYLSPRFVQTHDEFVQHKAAMLRVGDVRTFENFRVALPAGIDLQAYDTVVVWCESFGKFISAAKYR